MNTDIKYTPKVNILLSTYNGEAFLAEQLDSLLAQDYPNITIYVRDDGSTDKTMEILRCYIDRQADVTASSENPMQTSKSSSSCAIILLNEAGVPAQNLGYKESFWTLLRESAPADFYAFCDQDDYWEPDKISRGVAKLTGYDASLPLLYSSSFDYYDENMTYTGSPARMHDPIRFGETLFYTPAFGFTILINHTLRTLALSSSDLTDIPHDCWCEKLAALYGRFVYDKTVTARYRRHSKTVTYVNASKLQLTLRWIRNDIFGSVMPEYYFYLRRLYEEYGTRYTPEDESIDLSSSAEMIRISVSDEDLKLLELFRGQKKTVSLYFRRLFHPRRLRPTLGGEAALRICFLLNR